MAFLEEKAVRVDMRLRPVVSGVMRTIGRTNDRQALETAARVRLGSGAVLIRWEWDGQGQLTVWWATGPADPEALASCSEIAGEGAVFEADGDTLVVHTTAPHIWVGRGGWRVRALQEIWGVPVRVQKANAARCPAAVSTTSETEDHSRPKLTWLRRLAARLVPSRPAT